MCFILMHEVNTGYSSRNNYLVLPRNIAMGYFQGSIGNGSRKSLSLPEELQEDILFPSVRTDRTLDNTAYKIHQSQCNP